MLQEEHLHGCSPEILTPWERSLTFHVSFPSLSHLRAQPGLVCFESCVQEGGRAARRCLEAWRYGMQLHTPGAGSVMSRHGQTKSTAGQEQYSPAAPGGSRTPGAGTQRHAQLLADLVPVNGQGTANTEHHLRVPPAPHRTQSIAHITRGSSARGGSQSWRQRRSPRTTTAAASGTLN